MHKLARLEITEFVFTTDCEVDPHRKAVLVENSLRAKKLIVTENTVKAANSVPPMELDVENYITQNSNTNSDSCASNNNRKNKNTNKYKKDKNESYQNLRQKVYLH